MPALLFYFPLFLFPLLKIELRTQERYKITLQGRGWISVLVPRDWSLTHSVLKNSSHCPLSPQHGPLVSSCQAWEARPATQPSPVPFGPRSERRIASKIMYYLPIQGQPLPVLLSCPRAMSQQHYGNASNECFGRRRDCITEVTILSFIYSSIQT